MNSSTISPKFQVVIPKDIRESAGIKSGQKVVFIYKGGIIHMIPDLPLDEYVGLLKGMDTSGYRDEEDRY